MPNMSQENEEQEDENIVQLKAALWLPIGNLVDSTTLAYNKNASPQFIGALTELVWEEIKNVATDTEAFARHAGRKNVQVEDVLLLARTNPALADLLRKHLEDVKKANATKKK